MSSHPNAKPQARLAQSGDAAKIAGVINAAFRLAENFFIDTDRITVSEVAALLRSGAFLLIDGNDVLAGCVYVEPRGERAYLGLLSVNPALQKSGVGSQLMTAGEDHCRRLGCHFMDILIVNLRKDLPRFYEKRGYVETGTAPFPPDVTTKLPVHFITMTNHLD
jgi:GNAT superfamily N-acetyltransferase